MKISEIMTTPVITVGPQSPVKAAARLLADHDISALPVVDEDGKLVGIVSEADLLPLESRPDPRDQARPQAVQPRSPQRVEEIMTREVFTLDERSDVAHAADLMLRANVKRIPVLRGDRLAGIISRRDIIKVIARPDQAILAEIKELLASQLPERAAVEIEVSEGVATISGDPDEGSRRLVEILTRSIPGVLQVRFRAEKKA